MTDDIADRLRACEAALQARSQTVAELLGELEKAQTAQRAWTEIGAKAEATSAALRQAATDLTNVLTTLRYPDESSLWRLGGQALEREYQALKAALGTPADALRSAEERIRRPG